MIGLTRTILFSIQRLAYGWKRTTVARKKNLQLKKVLVVLREKQPQKSKLEPRIAKFISLVCNLSMMNQQMMEIGYNANKLPLGKLSKSTIFKGYNVLKRLSDAIDRFDMKALEQLSGEFCTLIPHEFGFKKMHEFVIDSDTPQKLKRKLEMVEALAEIEVATKLLKDDAEMQGDPLYAHYQRLHCELVPVEFGTEEFSMRNGRKCGNRGKKRKQGGNVQNEMAGGLKCFLIQRIGCFCGMVLGSQTGLEFYCHPTPTAADGVLLLCEVALGEMAELLTGKHEADWLSEGKLSTKGEGAIAPDFSKARELEDGLIVRLGKPKRNTGIKGSLWHNEYIVYNVDQIRMRYVANVKFKFKNRS